MPSVLTVRLFISVEGRNQAASFIVFSQSLPGERDAIPVDLGGLSLRLWFDVPKIAQEAEASVEQLEEQGYFPASELTVDVSVPGVSDRLVDFIYSVDAETQPTWVAAEHPLKSVLNEYEALGERALRPALKLANSVIVFARNEKGQYWIEPSTMEPGWLGVPRAYPRAQVRADGHDWTEWRPPHSFLLRFPTTEQQRFMTHDDLMTAVEFATGAHRSTMALEFLANAESLLESNDRRSALVEAVAALEKALADFSASPDMTAFQPSAQRRIKVQTLQEDVDRLGLRCSLRYLIPNIFDPNLLPQAVLKTCWEAVEMRNSIVHHGQRDVTGDPHKLVAALRSVCELLLQKTKPRPRRPAGK